MKKLVLIDAPHFCATAIIATHSVVVTKAAPIIGYMTGWNEDRVRSYCARKGWKVEVREQ